VPLKNLKPKEGDSEGEWIMSYADTVTLLLCFFVIFFSEAQQISEEETVSKELYDEAIEEKLALLQLLEKAEFETDSKEQKLISLEKAVEQSLKGQQIEDFVLIRNENDLSIRLKEKGFFKEASFRLLPKGRRTLLKIAEGLANLKNIKMIYIEGHTDSKPVAASAYYFSNLGLSSLRASHAAEVLTSNGLDKTKVRAIGYGSTQLVAQDRQIASDGKDFIYSKKNSSLNRRIEIRLLYQN